MVIKEVGTEREVSAELWTLKLRLGVVVAAGSGLCVG